MSSDLFLLLMLTEFDKNSRKFFLNRFYLFKVFKGGFRPHPNAAAGSARKAQSPALYWPRMARATRRPSTAALIMPPA